MCKKCTCLRKDALIFWLGFGLEEKKRGKRGGSEFMWETGTERAQEKQTCFAKVVQFA